MRILLFGKDGQVGRALQPALAPLGEVIALGRSEADFTAPESIGAIVRRERADLVVNAAAYTAVDAAEDDRDTAWRVNAEALREIGAAARQNDIPVIHYSTDYVYDGAAAGPHLEDEVPKPRSVYGQSKLAGEEALRASGASHVVLRTSWVYAPVGRNFPLTILRLARERDELRVVADQIGAPTPAALIAAVSAHIIARKLPVGGQGSLYHLAPSGATSWHGYAQYLVAGALAKGARLKLKPQDIQAITSSEYGQRAPRPANSLLDTARLRQAYDLALPDWRVGVDDLIEHLRAEGSL